MGAIPLIAAHEAIEQATNAAARARSANQFDRSLRLLEAVLRADPPARVRAEIQLEIGEVLNQQGLPALGVPHLEQVTDVARKNGWPDLFVAATLAHWNQSPFRKPADASTLRLLAEADELLGTEPSASKALVKAKTAVFNIFRKQLAERASEIERARAMGEASRTSDGQRLLLLESAHITYSCPAGSGKLDALDSELETLRSQLGSYFTDAAAPETSAFMHGRGDDLRRITMADDDRIKAQPIAEWRDLATRSTFAAFRGDIAEARELCDHAAEIGEPFWGESSVALHGFGQFFLDLVSDEWTHSQPLLQLLAAFSGSDIFDGALVAATHANGDAAEAHRLCDEIDQSALPSMGEHILGGNALVGFAEAAIRLDHHELATNVASALAPFEHLLLGVPWSASLAASDALARLALHRDDEEAADRHRAVARGLYASVGAPYLAQRM